MRLGIKQNKFLALALAGNIVFASISGWLFVTRPGGTSPASTGSYPYLSSRVFLDNQTDILLNFIPLRDEIRKYVAKNPEIGVYFEYLPSGISIGVNDTRELNLASLGKVPVAIAVMKEIELGTVQRDQVIEVTSAYIDNKSGDLWKKGVGTKLTVMEAVNISLKESDNTANRTLYQVLPEGSIERVFDSLDIPKDETGTYPVISPKNYSSMLKSLYLASYLNRESSNELLSILASTIFTDQLPAGVPKDIEVAHKVGSYDSEQVHSDCGIIYVPKRPYSLCVMVRADEQISQKHISLLSRMVYGYIVQVNQTTGF